MPYCLIVNAYLKFELKNDFAHYLRDSKITNNKQRVSFHDVQIM